MTQTSAFYKRGEIEDVGGFILFFTTPYSVVVNTSVSQKRTVFNREDGGCTLLRNVGIYMRVHTALQSRTTTWTSSPA
jgi:hypothetical protein